MSIEKFFKVDPKLGRVVYEEWTRWEKAEEHLRIAIKEFTTEHGFETTVWAYHKSGIHGSPAMAGEEKDINLYLGLTDKDKEKFGKSFTVQKSNGVYRLKSNTTLGKAFSKFAIERQLQNIDQPAPHGVKGYYGPCWGRSSGAMFMSEGVIYGQIMADDIKEPRTNGFIEIKGSEFYMICEEENERRKLLRAQEGA